MKFYQRLEFWVVVNLLGAVVNFYYFYAKDAWLNVFGGLLGCGAAGYAGYICYYQRRQFKQAKELAETWNKYVEAARRLNEQEVTDLVVPTHAPLRIRREERTGSNPDNGS